MSFENAFIDTIGLEGGYSNDPGDPGGETKYGISKKQYPTIDIKNLTQTQAKEIYLKDYWEPLKLDSIPNQRIHAEIFDTGVNCGVTTAIFIAQRAVNFLGLNIDEDGVMGPQTISTVNGLASKDAEALFKALNGFQFMRYVQIVGTSKDHRFARGWMRRIQGYRQEAGAATEPTQSWWSKLFGKGGTA